MKYNDRKICGLINLHSVAPDLRCPNIKKEIATKDSACDGCELFELYLKYREGSLELKREHRKNTVKGI